MPGPASTVVERPLRKISSEGTAVRSPLKEASFQTRLNLIRNIGLTEILSQTGSSTTQPRSREAVAAVLTLYERERSPNKLAL